VKGMFSCGKYQHENPIYMNVPEEFEQDYTGDVLLFLW